MNDRQRTGRQPTFDVESNEACSSPTKPPQSGQMAVSVITYRLPRGRVRCGSAMVYMPAGPRCPVSFAERGRGEGVRSVAR
jgi:hypothetical protein